MTYVSKLDLGRMVTAIEAEQNPLVKSSYLRRYVDMLDSSNGTLKESKECYAYASKVYALVISQLNKDDRELIKVFKKRADYCKEKAGL